MWVLLLIFAVIILLMMFVSAQLALGMIAMLFGFFPNPDGQPGWTWHPGAWLGYMIILTIFVSFVVYA
jgi:hypothetical protein